MIIAPEADRAIGMKYYITDTPGCGGVLRQSLGDFLVEEVWDEKGYEGGRNLVLEVEKSNWDTHQLIRYISRRLGISQKRISWAGTKDKHAITRQRISIMNLDEASLDKISLPGLQIKVLGRTNRTISLGDLTGNRFEIKIRDIKLDAAEALERISRITGEIYDLGGVPNYFGEQRFGDVRPLTHLVGEALVRGDAEGAVFIYLAMPFPDEPKITYEARLNLLETHDVLQALQDFPRYLLYERAILDHLQRKKNDYAGAFDVLAPNLKRLFVHAYQSYIFNKILSMRMESDLPIGRATVGDVVCFSKDGLPDTGRQQAVTSSNIDAVNRLILRERAYVTLPLFGHESRPSGGDQGELERAVLQEENVLPSDFKVAMNPDLGSRGTRRPAQIRVAPNARVGDDGSVLLDFFLPKGCYATVVLREYMKERVPGRKSYY